MIASDATFFDGEIAFDRKVTARLEATDIVIIGEGMPAQRWPLAGLIAIERPTPGRGLRLTHETAQATRLVLPPGPFLDAVVTAAPHLQGGITLRGAVRATAPWAAVIAGLAAILYVFLSFAPDKLAYVMPESWRKQLGNTTLAALTGDAKQCVNPQGAAALAALEKRLVGDTADPDQFDLRVYNIPIVNAFALPGGTIVVTGALIDKAKTPEEVAGVVAHEMGHVSYRHAEAGAIRVFGLQALIAAFTGGNDRFTEFGALLTILRFTRAAERQADEYALELMTREVIDPTGLKRFFESIKSAGESAGGVLGQIEGMVATHPGLDERIANIKALPAGVTPRPALSDADWQALRKICG